MVAKVKDVCHKCRYYNKKATRTYKCYTPKCPAYIKKRPRPKKRVGNTATKEQKDGLVYCVGCGKRGCESCNPSSDLEGFTSVGGEYYCYECYTTKSLSTTKSCGFGMGDGTTLGIGGVKI